MAWRSPFCIYVISLQPFTPGTYYAAVMENRSDFEGRVVVDVGAGSGILSLFAAQVHSNILHDFSNFLFFIQNNRWCFIC